MKAEVLIKSVVKKYGQKEEIEEYSKLVKKGLFKPEEKLIKKYFTTCGKVLNVGCGAGREAIALTKEGFRVVGIDLQPKMVETSRKNAQEHKVETQFLVMNACDLNFPDESFNYVLMVSNMISCIPKRINRIQAIREAKRVLKEEGVLIISAANRDSKLKYQLYFFVINNWRRCLKRLFNYTYLEEGDRFGIKVSDAKSKGKVYFHMYSMKEMIEDIETAGLKVIECKSREELEKDIEMPRRKTKDYFIYFVARK